MNGLLFVVADNQNCITKHVQTCWCGLQITLTKHKSQELLTHKINRRSLDQGRIL